MLEVNGTKVKVNGTGGELLTDLGLAINVAASQMKECGLSKHSIMEELLAIVTISVNYAFD